MRTATATIYTSPDDFEDIIFEYEFIVISGMIYINYVQLKLKLYGTPTEINLDIEIAVAEDLGKNPRIVRMDCEVGYAKVLDIKTIAA